MLAVSAAAPMASAAQPRNGSADSAADSPSAAEMYALSASLPAMTLVSSAPSRLASVIRTLGRSTGPDTAVARGPS